MTNTNHFKTKPIWFLILFGFCFFIPAVLILIFSIVANLYESDEIKLWETTNATLISTKLAYSHSDDSTSYQAQAHYQYKVNGQVYNHDRVSLYSGFDNIGSYQEKMAQILAQKLDNQQKITIYYNPDNPQNAIIDPEIRWEMMLFTGIFCVIFGGVGLLVMFFGIKGKQINISPQAIDKPWLHNIKWQGQAIYSDAQRNQAVYFSLTLVWNLIMISVVFLALPDAIDNIDYFIIAIISFFSAIGLYLIYLTFKNTQEWRRFGKTPLKLDPFPASINGDAAGVITINALLPVEAICEMTLSCFHHYSRGHGKNRRNHKDLIWHKEGYGDIKPQSQGANIEFRFSVPNDLPESTPLNTENQYRWNLFIEIKQAELSRTFELPVYPTNQQSRYIQNFSAEITPDNVTTEISAILPLTSKEGKQILDYQIWRKPIRSGFILFFASLFFGFSYFIPDIPVFVDGILLFVGSLIFAGGFYSGFNSLIIEMDGINVTSQRSLFYFLIKEKKVSYREIDSIEKKITMTTTTSGQKPVVEYQIFAKLNNAEKVLLAEQIKGDLNVSQAIAYFENEFTI